MDNATIENLRLSQFPFECGYSYGEEFCEEPLKFGKEFYIIEVRREFRPEAQRKGKWYYYKGLCKKHFEAGLKATQYDVRWHDRNKKAKNPQKVRIAHIWRITELNKVQQ